jgi:hypothetical protein
MFKILYHGNLYEIEILKTFNEKKMQPLFEKENFEEINVAKYPKCICTYHHGEQFSMVLGR